MATATCRVDKSDLRDRAAADPVGAYERAGLPPGTLRRTGNLWQCLCPLHADHDTPSFTVYPDGGWRCFGACQDGGDIIGFYMALHHEDDFGRACEDLGNRLDVTATPEPVARAPQPAPAPEAELEPIPAATVEACHRTLLADSKALAWLTTAKGLPEWIILAAKLGLSRDHWRRQNEAGEWRPETRYTIPIPDEEDGELWRDVRGYRPNPPEGTPKMKAWEKGRGRARVYPWAWVHTEQTICWTEGEVDALNLIGRGIAAVTATNGAAATASGALHIPDLRGKTVVVIGDNDDAGEKMDRELPPRLYEAGAALVKVASWGEVVAG